MGGEGLGGVISWRGMAIVVDVATAVVGIVVAGVVAVGDVDVSNAVVDVDSTVVAATAGGEISTA